MRDVDAVRADGRLQEEAKRVAADIAKWTKVVADAGIKRVGAPQ